ncbi:universal stress protein family protein [Halalkalicoccus paucihalophilus]|jgi:nucleotide-binding universal stress UspA family protein|uniref:Universal stress protein family protein n=1 Tax=Halalkalicoccus paucihalophilus TaxID=1008153 RepID=A0A151AAT5_9EURY|nr:universal stress protein [Halalkalicoccus paucihalophilus]KYH24745.1 universal stress protein family protein [Halalkalicoccus paucihalophilus]
MVIVAAISDSEQSRDIAARADELAQAFDDELALIHVIEETEYTRIVEKQSNTRETGAGSVEDNAAAQAADGLDEVISTDYDVIGRVGNPGKKVVEYADEVDARYVVVGGRARSPVGKALFGSVTQSILLNTERPAVTVPALE